MSKSKWTATDIPSQAGKVAIVTGANSGIGWHTALELARHGTAVIVTARTQAKGEEAVARIRRELPQAAVRSAILDLASLKSVRAFAATMAGEAKLDLLINNAGIMAVSKRTVTEDGFELQFGTNHLGHFALAALLLPVLLRAGLPVVTNVSSSASKTGAIRFDNLQGERSYRAWGAYCQSKLANLLFTFELQRRAKAAGLKLVSTAAHPGFAQTNLQTSGPGKLLTFMTTRVLRPLSQDAAHGALPTLYAATATVPAGYYGPDGMLEFRGNPTAASVPKKALDVMVAKRLWEVSLQLTGVAFAGL